MENILEIDQSKLEKALGLIGVCLAESLMKEKERKKLNLIKIYSGDFFKLNFKKAEFLYPNQKANL